MSPEPGLTKRWCDANQKTESCIRTRHPRGIGLRIRAAAKVSKCWMSWRARTGERIRTPTSMFLR